MWGIVPAAGRGSRIQPLAFSKELLPVGSRIDDGMRTAVRGERISGRTDDFAPVPTRSASSFHRESPTSWNISAQAMADGDHRLCGAAAALAGSVTRSSVRATDPDRRKRAIGLPDTVWFPKTALRRAAGRCAVVPAVPGGPTRIL